MKDKDRKIGNINHEYGNLMIKTDNEKFYWTIEAATFERWEEIPKFLFDSLNKFQDKYVDKQVDKDK